MLLNDQQMKELFEELSDFLNPKALKKLNSMFGSLWIKLEDLQASRDGWKEKYMALKGGNTKDGKDKIDN